MIKKKWLGILLLFYVILCFFTGMKLVGSLSAAPPDMSAINRIYKESILGFKNGTFQAPQNYIYDYAVTDSSGNLLFQTAENIPLTAENTIRSHGIILDLLDNGTSYGKAYIDTGYAASIQAVKIRLVWLIAAMAALLLFPVLLYTWYLYKNIVAPFLGMREFASHVAAGNLEFPLPMDQAHIFGAFTESFDIMREQLKESRQKEVLANQSKKELVASLSHDIKTPVASIKLTSELMLVTEERPDKKAKLETIYQKSEQIDKLITNLLQASLEDLGELKVNPREESSHILEDIVHHEDYYGKITMEPVPGCILMMDTFRMEQVIGNIINNSYKYANTEILVTSRLEENGLLMEFKDYGKGVPEKELPYLFNKFYRGTSHREKADGSGLGLYISHHLMEQSGGMISCFNREDGFSIILFIPFALPAV